VGLTSDVVAADAGAASSLLLSVVVVPSLVSACCVESVVSGFTSASDFVVSSLVVGFYSVDVAGALSVDSFDVFDALSVGSLVVFESVPSVVLELAVAEF